jgi:hypothetical protein
VRPKIRPTHPWGETETEGLLLILIWPIERQSVEWPPKVSFTNGGRLGIGYLMDRWCIGNQTDLIVK